MEIIRQLIKSDLNLIKDFSDIVIKSLEDKYADEDLTFKIRLILDELIINSYKHGNRYDNKKLIDALVLLDDDLAMVKVKDQGSGIIINNHLDKYLDHGRGITLVNNISDEVYVNDNTIAALIFI